MSIGLARVISAASGLFFISMAAIFAIRGVCG